jgi:hypothetical protein
VVGAELYKSAQTTVGIPNRISYCKY